MRAEPTYEIRIADQLDEATLTSFAGLDVTVRAGVTVITGQFDQAALHGMLEMIRSLGLDLEEVRREVEPAIEAFQAAGDDLHSARAWRLLAEVHWTRCQAAATEQALRRAYEFAKRSGNARETAWDLYMLAAAGELGPLPVVEGIPRSQEIAADPGGHPLVRARALLALAGFRAMEGSFETARELMGQGRAILGDVGLEVWAAGVSQNAAFVESLAGDPAAAERELRRGYALLQGMGEKAYLSTVAGELAQVVWAQRRYEEAETLALACREAATGDDIRSQVLWRGVQAKVLAARGRQEAAERLAQEAVEAAEGTDFSNMQGTALMDLAQVLRTAGRVEDAAAAMERAGARFARKGNTVAAERAAGALHALLVETRPASSGSGGS